MSRAKRHKRSECRRKHVSLLILQKSHYLALIWHIFIYVEILKYIINSHSLHLRSGPGAESALIRTAHLQHDLSSDDGKWHLYQDARISSCTAQRRLRFIRFRHKPCILSWQRDLDERKNPFIWLGVDKHRRFYPARADFPAGAAGNPPGHGLFLVAEQPVPLALAHPYRPDGRPRAAAALAGVGGGGKGDVGEVLGE